MDGAISFELEYGECQNNVPFQPPHNFASICKNSQIKARKSEQGSVVKIMLRQCVF